MRRQTWSQEQRHACLVILQGARVHAIDAVHKQAAIIHVYSKVVRRIMLIQINDTHQFTLQLNSSIQSCASEDTIMDKDRVVGSAKQIKGTVKQVVGKAVGDAKLEAEGNADKIEGQVQNAIGGVKDTLKGK
jgi:uncharacterized protein YjbJ (UPF0337 family)